MYDFGIIGGGPAGYVAAERAGQKGLKTILFEQKELGGVCLNEGCIPTKTLLYSAKIHDNAKSAAKYGINVENLSVDFNKIMKRKVKVIRKLVGGIKLKMKKYNIEVINGQATILGKKGDLFEIDSEGSTYLCKNILISTGSQPIIPPIKGLIREKIYTNKEILEITEIPESICIIGGGVIGLEFGSFFNSMGSNVSIIEMMDEILPSIDNEISEMLRNEYKKKGINFLLSSKVIEIDDKNIIYEKEGTTSSIEAEKILMSVGRKPTTSNFGLEKLGVELLNGGIKIDKQCKTNINNVYAAGDVTGFSLLAHTASREGEVVVNTILGRKDEMRYEAVPGIVYTNPEVSVVGLTEEEATKNNIPYKVSKLPMNFAGRFVAENEGINGLTKILIGEKSEVLGVHMIGNPSSEMIFGAALMIEQKMTIDNIEEIIFPHPTVSEIIKETIFSFND